MDSLTHIVLGAATGEAVLGKRVGNKALFWGAIAGSIPDFDVAFTPFFEPVTSLFVHRGFSHSIVFAIFAATLLGWIISRIHRDATFREWTLLAILSILSHSTIDCFNTYGTALLEPFSNARLAFDSIGIIDFFLLIPLTIFVLIILFKRKESRIRRLFAFTALVFTLIFVIFSVVNKFGVEKAVKNQLTEQGIKFERLKTAPLPLTNFLWLAIAEDSAGYHVGYFGNFDESNIDFTYISRNENLLLSHQQNSKIKDLTRFTDGFYTVEQKSDSSLWIHDLRFGSMAFESKDNWYVLSFRVEGNDNCISVSRSHPNRSFSKETIANYWERVFY